MPIVSFTGTQDKGETLEYTLDKTDLAAQAEVAADSYFSNQANWKTVSVVMRSDQGGQTKILLFDATQPTPTADLVTTAFSRNQFLLDRLTIFDPEGGQFTLLRSELVPAEFDVILEALPEAQSPAFSGTQSVGETLTASYSYFDGDGDAEGTTTYKWYRADDGVGTNEAAIGGATSSTYVLDPADENNFIRVGITPIALTGALTGLEAFSTYSGAIAAGGPPIIGSLLFEAAYDGANLDSDNPVLTPTLLGNPGNEPVLSGGKMTFPGAVDTASAAYYTLPSDVALGQTGAIHFDWSPKATVPAGNRQIFNIMQAGGGSVNIGSFYWHDSGTLRVDMLDDPLTTNMFSGGQIMAAWVPNAFQTYNFKYEWDFTGGVGVGWLKLYINDLLHDTLLVTAAGNGRTDTIKILAAGGINSGLNPQGHFMEDIDNIKVFDSPQITTVGNLVLEATFDSGFNLTVPSSLAPTANTDVVITANQADFITASNVTNDVRLAYPIDVDIQNKGSLQMDFAITTAASDQWPGGPFVFVISDGTTQFYVNYLTGSSGFYVEQFGGGNPYFGGTIPGTHSLLGQSGTLTFDWDFVTLQKVNLYFDGVPIGAGLAAPVARTTSTINQDLVVQGAPNGTATTSLYDSVDNVRLYDEPQFLT